MHRRRIKNEVWAQVKVHLNIGGADVARDDNIVSWFLDPDNSVSPTRVR